MWLGNGVCIGIASEKDVFMFNLIDEDASGYISRSEFREFLSAYFATVRKGYERSPGAIELGYHLSSVKPQFSEMTVIFHTIL
eukprot:COSAG05_NODE_317_length_11545_cov_73.981391_14_plen_83_part_00